ncbi:inositol monophosphatase family protein [filamentous cyanobacterium LEGE 11480]|uniref:Inositol monophosphatase family protein n=1 Tax=Romeriopsis navalis LEGE 11480 TaxID=2777977 RepID=A0A928Z6I8_9CYAN|nr:inositol monophosphatase family protein [Romeriopsis navalis]MBE9033062.1 inositol monophosphatase family protein [Romeriopsis navalis LEGE 11480]
MQVFEREAAIRRVVQDCGLQAKCMALKGFEVNQKGPGDFVTDVDRALDRALSQSFADLFPQDGIISEENPDSRPRYQQNPGGRLWCIDPIDGTRDFIETQQNYSVMTGLLENGQPRVGWIFDPAADEMYFGGQDWGLFCQQGDRVQDCFPQPPTLMNRVVIGVQDQRNYGALLQRQIPEIDLWERPGSFGLKILSVILGQAGMLVYFNGRVKLWDTVAPVAMARQAGLICCDLAGNPLSYAPDAIELDSLAHRYPVVIGWKHCIDVFLPRVQAAMAAR